MRITFGMTCRNLLNYTQLSIESVFREWIRVNPDPKDLYMDFVLVDNASDDGTKEHFEQVFRNDCITEVKFYPVSPKGHNYEFHYVRLDKNYGTPRSFNEIYKVFDATNGDLCILANNDIVVSKGYLEGLFEFYKDFPEAGMFSARPVDNQISDETKFKWFGNPNSILYLTTPIVISDEWEEYARNFKEAEKHQVLEGINCCLFVVTKDCRQTVGSWDEDFIIGCYDDCDYVLRAKKAGFRVLDTGNSVIQHFGGRTQSEYRTNIGNNNYQEYNKQIFNRKWNCNLDAMGAVCTRSIFWVKNKQGINEEAII